MSKPRPNLFLRATSELSQDAFLCWLLDWADQAHAEADPKLHEVARDFVGALFRAAGIDAPRGKYTVDAELQVEHADIVAEIGDEHLLVIEDKVHAGEHGPQLAEYRKRFAANASGRTLVLVYLKTGDQACYASVTGQGWAVFSRADLLEILRRGRGTVTNAIFIDFLDHVEEIESGVLRYRSVRPSDWAPRDPAYRGFYMELMRRLGTGKWNFVNNPARGFYGFWWGFWAIDGGQIYLQLQESKLVVRVKVDDEKRQAAIRDSWIELLAGSSAAPKVEFRRPSRRGTGKTMAVAVLQADYRKVDAQNFLDLEATTQYLQALAQRVEALARSASDASEKMS